MPAARMAAAHPPAITRHAQAAARAGGLGAFGVFALALLTGGIPATAGAAIVAVGVSLPAVQVFADTPSQTTWQYVLSLVQPSPTPGLPSVANPRAGSHANVLLHAGAVFGLNNFAGYIAGSCTGPAGWTCTARRPGAGSSAQALDLTDAWPADGFVDLAWTYVGPKLGGSVAGVPLGLFTAASWHGGSGLQDWSALAGPVQGAAAMWASGGQLAGPRVQNVSEPASLALAGLALLLAAGALHIARPRGHQARLHRRSDRRSDRR